MGDHHEPFSGMLQMNGLGLSTPGALVHLNSNQALKLNGSGIGGTVETHRPQINGNTVQPPINGTTTPAQPTTSNAAGSSSGRSTPNDNDPASTKLFVGGLSWQTSADKLRQYFGMFGNVTDVLIMKDPITQVNHFYSLFT